MEKLAAAMELPGEAAAGLPVVRLVGDGQVVMENHRGLLSYGKEEICVSGGRLIVKLKGDGLELKAMNGRELRITGHITGVELT